MGDETTGTTAISYAYDMDGIRRSKTVGGVTTEFVTQSGLVARQSWSGNTIDFFYDAQQRPYAMIYKPAGGTSATYYYLTNLQGDVIALLDESGSVVAEYEYGAWGDIRSITDSSGAQVTSSAHIASINPLRYRGYYYDTETGFYYLQSRYYDPVIKRFINADAAEYSALSALSLYDTNLFAYCRNNPVNRFDDGGDLSLANSVKIGIGVAAIAIGVGVTVLTGGAALPALVAGVKAACAAGVISAGISATTTAVYSAVSGDSFSTILPKIKKAAKDGFADGFMAGGIVAGASQVVSGGFKIAANLGAKTGKSGGIKIGSTRILSPDATWHKNNGGTLLKVGESFRIDVGSNTLLRMHLRNATSHIQIGTIGAGIYGGLR